MFFFFFRFENVKYVYTYVTEFVKTKNIPKPIGGRENIIDEEEETT